MAKFSQAFLQGLLQPSYQQGLFTAAQQAGQLPTQMRQMREEEAKKQQQLAETRQFQMMTPEQQFDFLESKAKTPQEILKVQGMRAEAAQTKAKAKKAEADAKWEAYTRGKTLEEDNNNKLVDGASLSAVNSGDINGYIAQLPPEISDSLKERIRQEAVAIQKSKEAAGLIATEKTLPQEYIDALQNNPKLVDSAEAQEQLRLYNNPQNIGDKKRAAFALRALVDAEDKRTRALYNSDTYAKDRAGDALRYLQSMESEVYFFESEDLPRIVQSLEGDDLVDFKRKLELEYRKNPSANPEQAARQALEQMQIETPGAELAEKRRAERTKLEEKREAAIQELMGKGMDRIEAETELNRQGEQIRQNKQQVTTAGIKAVRAAAKERKYGPSPRG
jgi:hypothetical protein